MNKTQTEKMTDATRQIQLANDNQIRQVSKILASAFAHDPIMNWVTQGPIDYEEFFRNDIESHYAHYKYIYINRAQTGAAVWLPPGITSETPPTVRTAFIVARLLLKCGVKSLQRAQDVEAIVQEKHIKEPHFYLYSVGAMQGQQGKGIGSALLKMSLAVCDAENAVAYLESSNARNNPLYQRFGFEIIDEVVFDKDGPKMWFMRREART